MNTKLSSFSCLTYEEKSDYYNKRHRRFIMV